MSRHHTEKSSPRNEAQDGHRGKVEKTTFASTNRPVLYGAAFLLSTVGLWFFFDAPWALWALLFIGQSTLVAVWMRERKKMQQALDDANSMFERPLSTQRLQGDDLNRSLQNAGTPPDCGTFHVADEKIKDFPLEEKGISKKPMPLENEMGERKESFSEIAEVAAGMAHEIGTPLNVIRMNAQLLARRFAMESAEKNQLDKIVVQTGRIADLIRDLLDTAKEEGQQEQLFDIVPLLHSCIKKTKELYPAVRWVVELEEKECELRGFGRRMDQALMNILRNACQAMSGEGVLGIRLHRVEKNGKDHARLLISDTGEGIDKKIQTNILQPFFTTKASGQGTGLGLTLTDRVVKRHGGIINVSSQKGQGALFEILLPVQQTKHTD